MINQTKSLERVVDGAYKAAEATVGTAVIIGAVGATVGALAAGIYEGSTGQKIFGSENPTMVLTAGLGYGTQLAGAVYTLTDRGSSNSDKNDALFGAIICPIGPIVGMAMYGLGYGIGKLVGGQ